MNIPLKKCLCQIGACFLSGGKSETQLKPPPSEHMQQHILDCHNVLNTGVSKDLRSVQTLVTFQETLVGHWGFLSS